MRYRIILLLVVLPLLALEAACTGTRPPLRRTNSALDFLYPQGIIAAQPANQVVLRLPVRVGIAFAPHRSDQPDPITEEEKQALLAEVAAAFEGEKNETRTVMDAVVYDVRSRALLFRAAGESAVKGWSSPVNVDRKRRRFAGEGFAKATDPLIAHLNTALARFEEQAASGTVQGPGTPVIAMYNAQGERVTGRSGEGGGGALGAAELITAVLLGLALLLGVRRPVSRT